MNILNKRIYKRIFSQWGKYLSMFLLLVLMISVTSGFFVVADSIKVLSDNLLTEGKVEDGQFISAFPISEESRNKIKKLGVNIEDFYRVDRNLNNKKIIRIYENRDDINLPIINEGRLAKNKNEIAINNKYALSNNLKIGDEIKIPSKYQSDNTEKTLKVVGFFAIPDYHASFSDNNDFVFDSINFGIGLVTNDDFSNFENSSIKLQYSYRFKDRNLDKEETEDLNKKVIKTANENNYVIDYIYNKDNNGINYVQGDMGGDRPMMLVIMSILIVLISFIFAVSMVKTIVEESEIIGILLASGYSKKQILWNYLSTPLIITIAAALVGNLLGYTAYIPVYKAAYYNSFDLPNFKSVFNLEALILTTVIPFFIIFIFNLLYINKKLRFKPLEFLKRDLRKNKKYSNTKITPKRFLNQFRMRVFLSNKADFIIIILGIFITGMLLIYGLSAKPTFDNYSDSVTNKMVSKYQYVLKAPIELKNNSSSAEKYTVIPTSSYHNLGKRDENIQFLGIENNSKIFKNLKLPQSSDEIVISRNLSKKLQLNKGDKIELKNNILDKKKTFIISDIYDFTSYFAAFTKQEYANDFIEKSNDYFNGYFSNEPLDIDKNYVATTIDKNTIINIAEQLNVVVNPTINALLFVSLVFFIIFMYNLTKMICEKNQNSIAYLKIFGYSTRDIGRIYLRSITITFLLTLIISIPLQVYLIKKIAYYSLLKFTGYIEFITPPYVIIVYIILSLITYLLVSITQVFKIKKMNFSEILKNRE